MRRIADFHSHILPGVDDGSASVEESIAMLRALSQQGVDHVVLTPHFYARYDKPDGFLKKTGRAAQALKQAAGQLDGLPQLSFGAEVAYFRGMSDCDFLQQLTIDGGKYILIEMPPSPWQDVMLRELAEIRQRRGMTPIIAHVDRYIAPFKTFGIPGRLAQLPVLVQANAEFFLKKNTARMACRMLAEGRIQLLGSDCHNMTDRRPNLGDALDVIERRLGPESVDGINRYESMVLGI